MCDLGFELNNHSDVKIFVPTQEVEITFYCELDIAPPGLRQLTLHLKPCWERIINEAALSPELSLWHR